MGVRIGYNRNMHQPSQPVTFPPDCRPGQDGATLARALSAQIVDEVAAAFGFSKQGPARRLLGLLLRLPGRHFARIAAALEVETRTSGFASACRNLLPRFVAGVALRGQETLPAQGPLLIAANHPGAYDVLLIAAHLPRDDLKIIFSTVPLLRCLPSIAAHTIPVTRDPHDALRALGAGIAHLRAGGSLLILPTGVVDPDPDLLPGAAAALRDWSRSLALILRRAPETKVVLAIASGVLAPGWLSSPLTRLQREPWRQRKLAEFLQVMQQLLWPGSLLLSPRLSFAAPFLPAQLQDPLTPVHEQIIARAQTLLAEHMAARPANDGGASRTRRRRM